MKRGKMIKNRKGQAAMEFLMTYGWAILAAVIVVGVLWYMIGNPANLAGDDFQMSAPFVANAMSISNESIQLEVRNGGATSFNVTQVEIENCGTVNPGIDVPAGELGNFTVTCSPVLNSGDRFNGDVTVRYLKSNSNIVQKATGSIRGIVP
ncbi:MAG TPA: hypothetical protein VJ912_00535 [Candidatus Nanoarchaeia archaeon]|nr:hypothetical protein [Candidatus Nanoarchaeia archaeon]